MALELTHNTKAAVKVRTLAAKSGAGPGAPISAPAATAEVRSAGPDGYGFLKSLPMFAELALPDMKALYRICTQVTSPPGST